MDSFIRATGGEASKKEGKEEKETGEIQIENLHPSSVFLYYLDDRNKRPEHVG